MANGEVGSLNFNRPKSGRGVIRLKKLNAAAILICIITAYGVFESIWSIAATDLNKKKGGNNGNLCNAHNTD